jgi:hypothetical protein
LAKQNADLHSLETMLLRAREIAEELGEVVIAYFIDMAMAETRRKNPPLATNYKPRIRGQEKRQANPEASRRS